MNPWGRTPSATPYSISLTALWGIFISTLSQTDAKGRKLRTDTPILLAGVSSYPRNEYELAPEKFNIWLDDTVDWLKIQYGDYLKNITLHRDEEHPHIHFYAVSPDGRAKSLHAGYQAESLVGIKDSKAKSLAYKEGMRQFQDKYYEDVSVKNGMLRDGPQRQRKSRAVHQAEKAHAKLLSAKIREIDEVDQLVAESFEQTYHETIEQAKQESAKYAESLMAETMKEANSKSNSMLENAKHQVEKMLVNARHEADLMRDEVMKWSKNTMENIRKLADAEAKVQSLTASIHKSN